MKMYLKSLLALVMTCGFALLSWAQSLVTNAFDQNYKYIFVGAEGDGGNEYTTLSNWKTASGGAVDDGDMETTTSYAPGTVGFWGELEDAQAVNGYKILLCGDNMPFAKTGDYYVVTFADTTSLTSSTTSFYPAWDLALSSNVHLKDVIVSEMTTACTFRIDATSKLTIAQLGNSAKMLNNPTFYVNSVEGLTVAAVAHSNEPTFTYHFGANGSAVYQGALSGARTHTIASVAGLESSAETKAIKERTLITYDSKDENQTFTLSALGEGWNAQSVALTAASAVGDYYLNITDAAVTLQYMTGPEETTDPGTGDGEDGGETGGGNEGGDSGESGGETTDPTDPDTGDGTEGDGNEGEGESGGETTDPDTGDSGTGDGEEGSEGDDGDTTTPDTTIPAADTTLELEADWSDLSGMSNANGNWQLDDKLNGYRLNASWSATMTDGVLTLGSNESAAFSMRRYYAGAEFRASKQATVDFYVSNVAAGKTTALAYLGIWEDRTPTAGSGYESHGDGYYYLTASDAGLKLEYAWTKTGVQSVVATSATNPLTDGNVHTIRMAYKNNTCKVYVDGELACELSEKAEGMGNYCQGAKVLTVKEFNIGVYSSSVHDYNVGFNVHGVRLYSDPEIIAASPAPIVAWQGFTTESLAATPFTVIQGNCTINTEGALVVGEGGFAIAANLPTATVVMDVEVPAEGGSLLAYTLADGTTSSPAAVDSGRQWVSLSIENAMTNLTIPLVGAKIHALYIYPQVLADEEPTFTAITESYVRDLSGEETWVDGLSGGLDAVDPKWGVKITGTDSDGNAAVAALNNPGDYAEVILRTTAASTLTMDVAATLTKLDVKGNSALTFTGESALSAIQATTYVDTTFPSNTSIGLLTVADGTTTLGANSSVTAVTVAEGATLVVPEGVTIANATIAGTVKGAGTLTNVTFVDGATIDTTAGTLTVTTPTYQGALDLVIGDGVTGTILNASSLPETVTTNAGRRYTVAVANGTVTVTQDPEVDPTTKWVFTGKGEKNDEGVYNWGDYNNWGADSATGTSPNTYNYPQHNVSGVSGNWDPIEITGTAETPVKVVAEDSTALEGWAFGLTLSYAEVTINNIAKFHGGGGATIVLRDASTLTVAKDFSSANFQLKDVDIGDGCRFELTGTVSGANEYTLNFDTNTSGMFFIKNWTTERSGTVDFTLPLSPVALAKELKSRVIGTWDTASSLTLTPGDEVAVTGGTGAHVSTLVANSDIADIAVGSYNIVKDTDAKQYVLYYVDYASLYTGTVQVGDGEAVAGEGNWSDRVGDVTAPTLTVSGDAALIVDAQTTITSLTVNGTADDTADALTIIGPKALTVGALTIADGVAVKVAADAVLRLPVGVKATLGEKLVVEEGGRVLETTNSAFNKTFTYVFNGLTDANYATLPNWDVYGTTAPTTEPGKGGSGPYAPILIDGAQIVNPTFDAEGKYKTVDYSSGTLEGWDLQLGVTNNVHLKIGTVTKLQSDGGNNNNGWIRVDGTSKLTIGTLATADSNVYGTTFYVEAPNGVEVTSAVNKSNGNNPGFVYHLGQQGSVDYKGALSASGRTHTIATMTLDVGVFSLSKVVKTRKLIAFASQTSQTFAITAAGVTMDGATATATTTPGTALTGTEAVGTYRGYTVESGDAPGYYVEYIGYGNPLYTGTVQVGDGAAVVEGNWSEVVGSATAPTLTVSGDAGLVVDANAVVTSLNVTGTGSLTLVGDKILSVGSLTIAEGMTLTIGAGVTLMLPADQVTTLGEQLKVAEGGTLFQKTNSAFGQTFNYVFNGGSAEYATLSNWDNYTSTALSNEPGKVGVGPYAPILIDGNQIVNPTFDAEGKYKTVNYTNGTLEGWDLQLGVTNNVHLSVSTVKKLQANNLANIWVYVDKISKVTIGTLGTSNQLRGGHFHIDAPEGLTVSNAMDDTSDDNNNKTFSYYLGLEGSVKYAAMSSSHNHTIASMTLDVGTPSLQKEVKTRKLIGFASQSDQTFSITATGVTTTDALVSAVSTDTALTGTEAVGTYRGYTVNEGDNQGYYVEYVAYKPIDNLIALWDDFTGLADEGLAPAVGFAQTQNSITVDGATLTFHKEGGSVDASGVLSTGTASAPRIALTTGEATVNVGHANFPITVVMAIEAPVSTTQFGKPFVHQAHATNTNNGIGIALQSTDYICGTWMNDIYSNGDHKWEIANLSGSETLYLLFTNMSGGSRVGFVADGTVTWKNCFTSSLRASSLEATDIFFGNYQGATANGMDFKLKSVALLAGTGTSLDTSILACVERMETDLTDLPTVPTWVGTTADGANTGTWNTTAENTPWQLGADAVAFSNGADVVFKDLADATTATVTVDANVSPASILVENADTAYTITPNGGVIQGGVTITKRGTESLTLSAVSGQTTNIGKIVVEEGTVTSGDYALQKDTKFGPEIEVKGGTLDLANSTAWNTEDDGLWLTESLITLGGSPLAAELTNGNIVPYKADNNSEMDFLKYTGSYVDENGETAYAPPATFAAAFANVYSNKIHNRSVIVEQGAGSREGGAGYDLEMSGGLGTSGQYAKAVLRKKGEGVLKISSVNNIPTLSIEAGTVLIAHAQAFSPTTIIGAGTTLDLNGFELEDGISLSGTGTLTNTSTTPITLYRVLLGGFEGTIDTTNITLIEPTAELTWMPFGDSITEGESSAVSYRHALWNKLTAMGYNIRSVGLRNATNDKVQTNEMWSWHNAWYGGFSMPIRNNRTSLYDNLDTCLEAGGYPDIITVLIGTNDAASYSGTASRGPQNLETRFEEWVAFIERMATLRPNSQIFVSTPPKNRGVNADIQTLGNKMREAYTANAAPFANHANVHFVDMWEGADLTTGDGSPDFISDGTHPNASGCEKIAEVWKTAITAVVDTNGGLKGETPVAPVIVEAFNPTADTIQVRFNKPLAETQSNVTATLTGADGITLTYTSADARTVTFTASANLPTLTELTVSVSGVTALDETTATAVTKTFTALGNGAAANVPEAYRDGFVLRQARDIPINATAGETNFTARADVPVDASKIEAVSQVAYYVELKREGKPAQFVWVSMDTFDYREAYLGIPTTTTGNHQQEVTNLRVYGNRGNFDNTAADATDMKGIVEFTPYSYTAADSDFTTIPDLYPDRYGWRDTLATSGAGYGSMQVAQIVSETAAAPTWAAAKMLFAINGFNTSSAMDLGVGSFATHLTASSGNNDSASNFTHDWTFVSATGITDVQPSAYTDARILEVWVKPMGTIVAKVGEVPYDSLTAAIAAATTAEAPITILSLNGVTGTLDLSALTIDWVNSTLTIPANVTVRMTAEQLADEAASVTVTAEGANLQIVMSLETILAGCAIDPTYLANEKVTVGVMTGDTFTELNKTTAFDANGVYALPEDEPFVQVTVDGSAIALKGAAAAFYTLSNPDNKVTVATENKTNSLGASVPTMAKAAGTPASVALNIPLQNTTVSFWATRAGENWDDSFGIDYLIGGEDTVAYRMQVWERNASSQVCVYGGDAVTSGGFPATQDASVPLAGPAMSCADDNLHHWVVVTKETTQDFYMDGTYQGTRTYSAINTASTIESIGLGGSVRRANNNNYGTCSLADVRVYRTALSISEIDTLYRGTKAKFTATIDSSVENFSDIQWEGNVTDTPTAEDTIVLNVSGDVTLHVASALTAGRLMVNVAETATSASLTLTGSAAVTINTVEMNASLDVSKITGTVALSTAKVGAGTTFAAKKADFTTVTGTGTLYLTAGTLVHSSATLHRGLTIKVAKDATFKATDDVAVDSGTTFVLEGGAIFLIPAQKWVNVPITVAENTEPAKIYGASTGNNTAFKGEIILNGDLELADAGNGGGNKYRIDGVISGSGKLIVNDVNNPDVDALNYSSIQLTAENTFTGGLVIGAGVTLNVTTANSAGAGDIVIAESGTLKNTSEAAITIPAGKKLAGGGTVTGAVTFADGAILDATEGAPTIKGAVTFTTNLTVALPALAATSTEAIKVLVGPDGTNPTGVTYTFTFAGTASWVEGDLYVTPAVTVAGSTVLPDPEGDSPDATVEVNLTEPVVQAILTELKQHNDGNGDATDVTKITEVTVTGVPVESTDDEGTTTTTTTTLLTHSPEAAHLFTDIVTVEPTEGSTTGEGKATIVYDFGIDRLTMIDGYIVVKAKVKGASENVDFAEDTEVQVIRGGESLGEEIESPFANDPDHGKKGVKWFRIPHAKVNDTGTHTFTIKAKKKAR